MPIPGGCVGCSRTAAPFVASRAPPCQNVARLRDPMELAVMEGGVLMVATTAKTLMSESELSDAVLELAHLFGWKCAHFRPARTTVSW